MNFNFENDRPIYIQLVEQLKLYIISDETRLGSRLPSVRDLALQAKVNPNTLQKALLELENEKLIFTERTNGKFITSDKKLIIKYKENIALKLTTKYVKDMQKLGINKNDIISHIKIKEEKE